jgi:hypothetical protein
MAQQGSLTPKEFEIKGSFQNQEQKKHQFS